MTSTDDWKKTVRLNKLLGMWAAEKLGITGEDAEAYSDALAVGCRRRDSILPPPWPRVVEQEFLQLAGNPAARAGGRR